MKKYFVIFVIFSIVFASTALATTPPNRPDSGDVPQEYKVAPVKQDTGGSTQEVVITSSSHDKDTKASVPTVISFPGELIEVVKTVTPINDEGAYNIRDTLRVSVEIHPKSDKDVTLNIREYIEDGLNLVLPSVHGYKLSTIEWISFYKAGYLEEYEYSNNCLESGDTIRLKANGYEYDISKNNLIEINSIDKSYNNGKEIFVWEKISNTTNLSEYPNLVDLLINKFKCGKDNITREDINSGKLNISPDRNTIEINIINSTKNKSVKVTISKNPSNYLDKNYSVLSYMGNIHHIRCKYKNDLTKLVDASRFLCMDDVTLTPDSIFVYWYNITPKRSGIYQTNTIVNSTEPKRIHISTLNINIKEDKPIFNVYRKVSNSQVYKGDELPIEFDIVYEGGVPKGIDPNVTYRFDRSKNYKIYNNESCNEEDEVNYTKEYTAEFAGNRCISIVKYVKFNTEGNSISPPDIWINGVINTFDKDIVVDTLVSRNLNYISLIVGVILVFLSIFLKDILLDSGDELVTTFENDDKEPIIKTKHSTSSRKYKCRAWCISRNGIVVIILMMMIVIIAIGYIVLNVC